MSNSNTQSANSLSASQIKRLCRQVAQKAARIKMQRSKETIPNRKPEAILLRACYRLTDRAVATQAMGAVREAVPKDVQPRGKLADLPAAWILSCVLAEQGAITKSVRNKIRQNAFALDYAAKKQVPIRYLIGFIHQCGGLKSIEARYVAKLAKRTGQRG